MNRIAALTILSLASLAGTPALAQSPPPFERIPLQSTEWPPGYNSTSMAVKFQPNAALARHTHPGIESGYLVDGELVLKVTGKPDVTMKSGGSWVVPAEVVHAAVAGAGGATVIATFVVDKNKPLSTPAP